MQRNIKLTYIIISLMGAYFWFGIWYLYYLRYTNNAGVGFIECLMGLSSFLLEIPTGAIADILGKKRTIILATLLSGMGTIFMGVALDFSQILISLVIIVLGYALLSGTYEALVFDSLKVLNKEEIYDNILAKITKYQMITIGISSVLGGFMYSISPGLPYIATGICMLVGFVLAFFLVEPKIDSIKFSLKNYRMQLVSGFKELFHNLPTTLEVTKLLITASFIFVVFEFLDYVLADEFGFTEQQVGILFAVAILCSAIGSHFYDKYKKMLASERGFFLFFITILISAVISPVSSLWVGGASLVYRFLLYPAFDIISSTKINKIVTSKNRATGISTYNMLKRAPYIFLAYFVGSLVDQYKGSNIAFVLAIIFGVLIIVLSSIIYFRKKVSVNESK